MLKKISKALFFIPPEIKFYFDLKLFNFFFFGLSGWFFQKLFIRSSLLYSHTYNLLRVYFSSFSLFNNFVFGLIKSYFKYFQLRGRSFRYVFSFTNLILKFGFSHKVFYILSNNLCITLINKQVLKISGKSLQKLKSIFFDLHCIRRFDKYKGKGLLYYKDSFILKVSSKKAKV